MRLFGSGAGSRKGKGGTVHLFALRLANSSASLLRKGKKEEQRVENRAAFPPGTVACTLLPIKGKTE